MEGGPLLVPDPVGEQEPSQFSVSEAAQRLGVSRVSIWRWIRDGELAAARIGHRTTRIRREDLEALLVRFGPSSHRLSRKAPLDDMAAGEHPDWSELSSGHFVQFYESDDFLVDSVADYLADGLRRGAGAIAIATEPHRQALDERLGARYQIDLARLRAARLYQTLDAQATLDGFMVDGLPDRRRFRAQVGRKIKQLSQQSQAGVRAFGEMVALLAADGNEAATVRLEALWNELLREQNFGLFCAYPMDSLQADTFSDLLSEVCDEHSRVLPTDTFLSIAADELKKPIAALKLQTQLALQALPATDDGVAHALQVINAEAARLSHLVAHLLERRGGSVPDEEYNDVPA